MPPSGRSRRPVGDLTGRQSEELAAKASDQLAERSGQITTVNPSPEPITIDDGALVDLTNPSQPRVQRIGDDDLSDDEQREIESQRRRGAEVVEVGAIEVSERTRLMRVSEKIDPVIGFGPNGTNEYHFEPGVLYKVPEVVYDHLDDIGFVYH